MGNWFSLSYHRKIIILDTSLSLSLEKLNTGKCEHDYNWKRFERGKKNKKRHFLHMGKTRFFFADPPKEYIHESYILWLHIASCHLTTFLIRVYHVFDFPFIMSAIFLFFATCLQIDIYWYRKYNRHFHVWMFG